MSDNTAYREIESALEDERFYELVNLIEELDPFTGTGYTTEQKAVALLIEFMSSGVDPLEYYDDILSEMRGKVDDLPTNFFDDEEFEVVEQGPGPEEPEEGYSVDYGGPIPLSAPEKNDDDESEYEGTFIGDRDRSRIISNQDLREVTVKVKEKVAEIKRDREDLFNDAMAEIEHHNRQMQRDNMVFRMTGKTPNQNRKESEQSLKRANALLKRLEQHKSLTELRASIEAIYAERSKVVRHLRQMSEKRAFLESKEGKNILKSLRIKAAWAVARLRCYHNNTKPIKPTKADFAYAKKAVEHFANDPSKSGRLLKRCIMFGAEMYAQEKGIKVPHHNTIRAFERSTAAPKPKKKATVKKKKAVKKTKKQDNDARRDQYKKLMAQTNRTVYAIKYRGDFGRRTPTIAQMKEFDRQMADKFNFNYSVERYALEELRKFRDTLINNSPLAVNKDGTRNDKYIRSILDRVSEEKGIPKLSEMEKREEVRLQNDNKRDNDNDLEEPK